MRHDKTASKWKCTMFCGNEHRLVVSMCVCVCESVRFFLLSFILIISDHITSHQHRIVSDRYANGCSNKSSCVYINNITADKKYTQTYEYVCSVWYVYGWNLLWILYMSHSDRYNMCLRAWCVRRANVYVYNVWAIGCCQYCCHRFCSYFATSTVVILGWMDGWMDIYQIRVIVV